MSELTMNLAQLTKRVEKLEKEIKELQNGPAPRSGKWWVENSGKFVGDRVYAEIVRRGRTYRKSLRPKVRKSKR